MFRNLCWWLPRCLGCGFRSPIFNDGLCFQCSTAEMEARVWRQIGEAVAKAIPILVDAWLGNPRPTVRTMVRRKEIDLLVEDELTNTGYRRDIARAVWEVAFQLAVHNQTVERTEPSEDAKPGEAKP